MGCEGENINNENELLQKIMEYKFAINDMALYLDTHPTEKKALEHHNNYVDEFKKLKEQYESKYGPLNIESQVQSWCNWTDEKWPWEREVK